MTIIWFYLLYKCWEIGVELTRVSMLLLGFFYIGDCILIKGILDKKDS